MTPRGIELRDVCFLLLLVLGSLCFCDHVWAQPGVPSTALPGQEATVEEQALRAAAVARQQVDNACLRDPALSGAWAFRWNVKTSTDSSSVTVAVSVMVEAQSAGSQLKLLEQLVHNSMQPKPVIDKVYRIPLKQSLDEAQTRIRLTTGDKGRLLRGIRYRARGAADSDDSENVVVLLPFGRARNERQRGLIKYHVEQIRRSKDWQAFEAESGVDLIVDTELLPLYVPSEECIAANASLQRTMGNNSAYRGVWVELCECRDAGGRFVEYDAYVWQDDGTVPQTGDVQALLAQLVKDKYELVYENMPLKQLVRQLNLALEQDTLFDGCYVQNAEMAWLPNPGDIRAALMFNGRAPAEDLQPHIQKKIEKYLMHDPAWRGIRERIDFAVLCDNIEGRGWSRAAGAHAFQRGKELLRRGQFAEAEEAFLTASLDSPEDVPYRYWRVLSLLQAGRYDEALAHMRAVRRRGITHDERIRVVRSMEDVQGSARAELLELEFKASLPVRR